MRNLVKGAPYSLGSLTALVAVRLSAWIATIRLVGPGYR